MEVLHLDFDTQHVAWLSPLQTRLRKSSADQLRQRYTRWGDTGLGDLALAIATRLAICDRVQQHLGKLMESLATELGQWDGLNEAIEERSCFRPSHPGMAFDICAAVDSLIAEFRALYELIVRQFAIVFMRQILKRKAREDDVLQAIQAAGVDVEWVDFIRDNRNFLLHLTAPWTALEVHQRDPLRVSLLVMKKNIAEFDDPTEFITTQQLVTSISGLREAVPVVRRWLEGQLEEVEAELLAAS